MASEIKPIEQKLFTIAQTGKRLGRSRASIWRDIARGRLQIVKLGRSVMVRVESIDHVIQNGWPDDRPKRPPPRRRGRPPKATSGGA